MKIARLTIQNFRGISSASLLFPDHAVLIGDNNTGKSTVLEAIDLVAAVSAYFRWAKGSLGIADFLALCNEDEIPQFLRDVCRQLKVQAETTPTTDPASEAPNVEVNDSTENGSAGDN